jgi:hypothetical protein
MPAITDSLAALADRVFILDLDVKPLVLKILSDHYDLLLPSESPSSPCLPAEVIILLFSEY